MGCDREHLSVQHVVIYCMSSGMGVHVASRYSDTGMSRQFLHPPYVLIKVVLRFVHSVLRLLFDLSQHVYVALPLAEVDVLGRKWWVVGKGLAKMLLLCAIYQAVVILPAVALDQVAQFVDLGEGIVDELVELVVLGIFVMVTMLTCWMRYKKLVQLGDLRTSGRILQSRRHGAL